MIKQLFLSHFVLVEQATISFSPHFNVITGETGAGKTAIIEALSLALGARADTSLIRQGSERAIVEASFDIGSLISMHHLLSDAGIDYDPKEELIIRREISHEGKNRAYINCRQVPLPFLHKVGSELIDFIGQHAILNLKNNDFQRSIIDLYGALEKPLSRFKEAYKRQKLLSERCEELTAKAVSSEKQQDLLRYQLDEIQTASLQPQEDEKLFETYKRLSQKGEISEKLQEILDRLSDAPTCILTQLSRTIKLTDSLIKIDPFFQEVSSLLQQSHIFLNEVQLHINSYSDTLEQDPKSLSHIENRLSHIAYLKKKYGQSLEEIETFKHTLTHELDAYENLAARSQEAQQELALAQEEANVHAHALTLLRKKVAYELEKQLTLHLQFLNMSKAEVHIEVIAQQRTQEGDDAVQFYLKANPGEASTLVREHASGGELSRLFLAIKLALSDKNKTPTLIFDEIDANVGGTTASIIGTKLAELGKMRQILCVTHFPQVAAKADCHFSVHKQERDHRTVTEISLLSQPQRESELIRMLGGEKAFSLISK